MATLALSLAGQFVGGAVGGPIGATIGRALGALAERWLLPGGMAPGAVLLFRIGASMAPRHCGIFVGDGRFVHAQERLSVVEGNLTDGWARRVTGVFAFPD